MGSGDGARALGARDGPRLARVSGLQGRIPGLAERPACAAKRPAPRRWSATNGTGSDAESTSAARWLHANADRREARLAEDADQPDRDRPGETGAGGSGRV